MTTTTHDAEVPSASITADATVRTPIIEILREISRGGIAGLIVGLVVGGIGGRLVMRLAALLVPTSVGAHTENGNVIGDITAQGTVALILFAGLALGVVIASLWVMVSPWLPTAVGRRAVVAALLSGAVGTPILVQASNIDFVVLRRDLLVVASLVALVALIGPALVVTERWLDRRLPHASGRNAAAFVYTAITLLGTGITLLLVPALLTSEIAVAGFALLLVGLATLATWVQRVRGDGPPDPGLSMIVRVALVVAIAAGLWGSIVQVRGALGLF
jgi:hypothetical protein